MIKEENIWDLVSSRSYHSCLITTYSFDFYYFEKSVMRILRSKGIGNISLFIDDNIFQGILGKIGSSNSKVYSINPIKSTACFHPKVYMFFGEKQGLLIIGSGNLTSSGHGKNDEIWGAFHFDVSEPRHTQLFANSWSFFEKISRNIKGYSKEKIKWIKEYTPWIETLPSPVPSSFESLDNLTKVAFLNNNLETSIFQQLSLFVPFDKVIELTIIAPYYDSKGKIIELFLKLLPKAKINVLLDDENGILPSGLSSNIASKINFYHWRDCFIVKDGNKDFSRLHAKLFNFKLDDNSNLCLLGSANASVAAIGTESISATNEEVAILLNSKKQDYLKDLGIKINPKKSQKLSDFEMGLNESSQLEKSAPFKYNIEAIDKEGSVLNVFLDKNIGENITINIFNNWGEVIYDGKLINKGNYYYIKIPSNLFNPLYGCLIDSDTTQIISNKQIIQDIYVLSKTNPDPQKQILDILFSSIEQGDELLFSKLIDCISTNDFYSENVSFSKKTSTIKSDEEKKDVEIKGKILDYEHFKDVSYHSMQHQYSVLNSSSNRVADFLSSLSITKTREEVVSDELEDEEVDLEITNSQGREDQPELRLITKSAFNNEKLRIIKFFERYDIYLEEEVDKLIKKSNQNIDEEDKVTITDLSNFVIALYITIYYTDKKRQYFIDEETTYHDSIIKSFGFNNFDNLPVINAEIVGKFLLICTKGFKTYDSDYLNERLLKLKHEAFYHCIFCLGMAKWSGSKTIYKNLLLINSIHYLGDDINKRLYKNKYNEEMFMRKKLSSIENLSLVSDIKLEINTLLPKYLSFIGNLKLKVSERKTLLSTDLKLEAVIFTSRFGFCIIKEKSNERDKALLTLSRPGFPWNNYEEEYLLQEKRLYLRNIVFDGK